MTQSGQPGSPGQPQQPAPLPPPPSWQQAPQQPVPPPPPPPRSQMPAWTANLTSTTPVAGPSGYFYADVPNRSIAYIIDLIIIGIISFIVAIILGGIFGGVVKTTNGFNTEINYGAFILVGIANLAISAGYFIYMWSKMRATVGMRVLGLQVGDEKDGRSITMEQGFKRWLIIGIPSILSTFSGYANAGLGLLLSLIGVIWLIALLVSIAQSATKQGYHDRYAHTIMVKAGRQAA